MKKFLFSAVFLLLVKAGFSQFNNSWINYNNTYYKFYVAKDTLCRIPQSALATAGLGSVPAQNFQLWRNGKQVRLYTSVNSGPLSASDYIEFWGEMNDGKPDKELYREQNFQLSQKYNLFTDTAAYYLTVNASGGNLRYTDAANPVITNVLPPDPYFMRRVEVNYKNTLNSGFARVLGNATVYSSSFEQNEGWTSRAISSCCFLSNTISNLNKYAAGPPNSVMLTVTAAGANPLYTRELAVRFGSTQVFPATNQAAPMPYYAYRRDTVRNLPLSLLASNSFLSVSVGPKKLFQPGG